MSGLPKNVSIATALGTAALVGGIHAQFTPGQADIRTSLPGTIGHSDVNRSRRQASWFAAGAVGLIYLLTKDKTTFIVGGATVVAFDAITRYNNEVFPPTQRVEADNVSQEVQADAQMRDAQTVGTAPYANVM